MAQFIQRTNQALLRSTLLAAAIWGISDVNAGTWAGGNENKDFAAPSNWDNMNGTMYFGTGNSTVSSTFSSGTLTFSDFQMATGTSSATWNITGGDITIGGTPGGTKPQFANGGGTAIINQSGGIVRVKGRAVTSESKTSNDVRPVSVWNLSGGTLAIGVFSHGSQGAATINISQTSDSNPTIFETYDNLTGSSAFIIGYNGVAQGAALGIVNQSGGTTNIWGNVNDGWNLRANPGFMSDYARDKTAGLQIGNTGWGGSPSTISPAQYLITNGTLNTYRVYDLRDDTNETIANSIMLEIAGGNVNIVEDSMVSYSGLLAANTRMTAGTLNASRILAKGNFYDNSNELKSSEYHFMKNGTFVQEGGVLSPDGGSVQNNTFIPNENGISSTTIEGNYALTGTGTVKLDIVSKTDWTQNDLLIVTGNADLGGVGISVNPVGGLTFTNGDSIKLVTANSFTGTTIDRTSGNLADGYYWTSSVKNGTELWGTVSALPCYWNQNSSGTFTDLSKWNANYASAPEAVFGGAGFNAEATLNTSANVPTFFMAQDNDSSAKLTIADGGKLTLTANAPMNIAYHGNAAVFIQNGGTLSPDDGSVGEDRFFISNPNRIGSTTISGNYVLEFTDDSLSVPTIMLDLADNAVPENTSTFDTLNISGDFNIGNDSILALQVGNLYSFENTTFDLISADSITGEFSELHISSDDSSITLDSIEEIANYLTYSDNFISPFS